MPFGWHSRFCGIPAEHLGELLFGALMLFGLFPG
jgi:hypothetical protein